MAVFNTMPIDPSPILPIDRRVTHAIDEAKFGDGYTLETEAGINSRSDAVSLRWEGLTKSERAIVYAFLSAHSPTMPFILPSVLDGVGGVYTCPEFSQTQTFPGLWNLSANLKSYNG